MKRLEGKIALVTGSSRGIGQQIAIGLAREGCDVIIHGRKKENTNKTKELLTEYGVKVDVVEGDLTQEQVIKDIVSYITSTYGKLDILYNNAAIQGKQKPIWEFTKEDFEHEFENNFYPLVRLCQAFAPMMQERGYGRIINLSSGIKNEPNLSPYGTSKAMVDKFTEDLAAALNGSGVLVNALDPGWLKTDLGGPHAWHEVESVLPGAIELALYDNDGPNGQWISAQDFHSK
ncbi:SDR family NAD(P)-dependent oxidoreductase [Bacillus sp. HMF5848]|uniref:SDR family NAD(P)-dependent oxidoreductase n=1 Tax=Bacillus sp. HMF5848 TaxID=2495421 RepID=UPI001C8B9C33|nr:SDR family oxidoreductase [Bacillus sp. HMF5848]